MRRDLDGLSTPYPLATLLPAFLQEDQFVVRLTAGLDDVIAPAISVLDCLDAYVDPLLAPTDFVEWLAAWIGAPLDDNWDEEKRRCSVLAAASLHRQRGTPSGLRAAVELATGGLVDIEEPGGTVWSRSPTQPGATPGDDALVVRVRVEDPDRLRVSELEELVRSSKPAHLPHRIEVLPR